MEKKSKKFEIKQTKTSRLRLAQANPLLGGDEKFKEISKKIQTGTIKPSVSNKKTPIPWNNCNKIEHKNDISKRATFDFKRPIESSKSLSHNKRSTLDCKRSATDVHKRSLHEKSKPKPKPLKTQLDHNFKMPVPQVVKVFNKIQPRRSLSAEHFERKRHLNKPLLERILEKSEITQSSIELSHDSSVMKSQKFVTFKTPEANKRRSRFFSTPSSDLKLYHSTPTVSSTPSLHDLQKRLNDWLQKRGKSVATFHHLKCFARQTPVIFIDDENKENDEPESFVRSDSYDNLNIKCNAVSEDTIKVPELIQYEMIVKDALIDLKKLITDGYSLDQCEAWLASIRQKYKKVDEELNYWECRAAVEQARGNLSSAVECYKTAIVKGAEVDEIDESLDHLLKKFSLLDIEAATEINGKKDRLIKEARNIFKSSIIQFAVQERNMKKSNDDERKFVVTPVRRSTRQSRSKYVSTPGVKLCNSLQNLDESCKESLSFKNNNFL